MNAEPTIAAVASLIGDPTRAAILTALMDGQARTATELALEGEVTTSTVSSHLARLTDGGLITVIKQGRHRYFRLATPEVGAMLESLMVVAAGHPTRPGPRDAGMRRARLCYDHLAGEAGVRLLAQAQGRGYIAGEEAALALTKVGEHWLAGLGIDVTALRNTRRHLCRGCLDWSERRMHLAGAAGAAIMTALFERGYACAVPQSRVVTLSLVGECFIERLDWQ